MQPKQHAYRQSLVNNICCICCLDDLDSTTVYTSRGHQQTHKVDHRKHGKRPFPGDESEAKEEADRQIFEPFSSARSQQEMSAMVSALAQVIGNNNQPPAVQVPAEPLITPQSTSAMELQDDQSHQLQAAQDQGFIYVPLTLMQIPITYFYLTIIMSNIFIINFQYL